MTSENPPSASMSSACVSVPATARAVVPLLSYQEADVLSPARFSWCCWSRQVGKSFTKSLRRLLRGIERRRTQIFLSAGERQSLELMLKAQQHCKALNIASRVYGDGYFEGTRFRKLTLSLPNGVRVIGLPANAETARGFTGDVLLDEFAMHRDDRAIWASIFPSALRGGGEIDVASTPKGCGNLFAELRENDRFARSLVTIETAVKAGLDIDVDEIRSSMHDEELFQQEFCCVFLDEATAFLTHAQIIAIEAPELPKTYDLHDLAACAGALYVGVDIGRVRDLTVMWVFERVGDMLVTRGIRETVGEPFREQSAALSELLSLRGVHKCAIDAGGIGMPLAESAVEAFGSQRVEPVMFTPSVKDRLATGLRLRVEEGTVRIPADESIRNDWHSVRRSISQAGPVRYEASRAGGGHADRFWAAALAVRAAGERPQVIEAMRGERLRFAIRGAW